jgi:hypothetical protein
MGIFINKGNEGFRQIRNSEYIDKSGLISVVNKTLFTRQKMSCVTRCRRFGKSMAAEMLAAYYDHSCDSRQLFADLQIASDPSFEQHLNKYAVIFVDMTTFTSNCKDEGIVTAFQEKLIKDIRAAYPQVEYQEGDHLMVYLQQIVAATGDRFFMIIDEWDAVCRVFEDKPEAMDRYLDLLRRMFKDVSAVDVFAGVYMTGILPVKKYNTQSAMNNFLEYSMVEPMDMSHFFGFTKDEVKMLAERHQMEFDELEKWYDGYQIGDEKSIFNPNSVIMAIKSRRCRSFWASTGAFDTVAAYISMNFDGLKDDIIEMLAGGRAKVNTTKFRNDLSAIRSRDDVLTVLIHLGYLSFDWEQRECYVPNYEVSEELANAVEETGWTVVARALQQSERLLTATLRGNAEAVAHFVEAAHDSEASIYKYNDENTLSCVISIAYYYAHGDYIFHRELATGRGYADLVLMPRKNVSKPAIVIELKNNETASKAIAQIKDRHYTDKIAEYTGNILLVGISYDAQTKQHTCQIEQWLKE